MAWSFLNTLNYVRLLIETTNGQLLSFDLIIKSVINNLPAGYWSFDNLLNWYLSGIEFSNFNTYLDDSIIIQIGYQSLSTHTK
jgi:hypothetical protein